MVIITLFDPTGTKKQLEQKDNVSCCVTGSVCSCVITEKTAALPIIVIGLHHSLYCYWVVVNTQHSALWSFLCVWLSTGLKPCQVRCACGCQPRNLIMFLLEHRGNANIAQKVWEQSKRQTNTSLQQAESELHEYRPGVSHSKCQRRIGFRHAAKYNKQKTKSKVRQREKTRKDNSNIGNNRENKTNIHGYLAPRWHWDKGHLVLLS